MPNYKIDEINVLENYTGMIESVIENEGEEIEEEDLRELKNTIKKLKNWIKEIKSTGETHKNLEWKIEILSEILDNEKNIELIPAGDDEADEEGMEIQKEYIEGIEEWLYDLKNELRNN